MLADSLAPGRMLIAAAFCFGVCSLNVSRAADEHTHRSWEQYGGSPDQSKFVRFTQITKSNVSQLQIAWTYAAGDGSYMFNPIVVDGVMYVLGKSESLVALDAATGREIWTRPNLSGIIRTGINY